MLKKFFMSFIFFIFMFVSLYTTTCYATSVTITDENLSKAFENFVSSDANENNYNISVSNNIINVIVDNESYTLKYDLANKPTFSLEIPIEKGMSYEKFKKQTENLNLPMLGYIAVANIQGVEINDASTYFLLSYLEGALNGSYSSENSYMIVDDLNLSKGVTIEKTEDSKTIYTSEFGDRVLEYVNNVYKNKQTITDSSGINSYVYAIEKEDITDTSCKLVSTLSVNLDSDFSKINGYSDNSTKSGVTEENADYTITLKVGQKCKIETSEKFKGYELHGSCVEIDTELAEITAIKKGTADGYLFVGDETKSIYIIVKENEKNETPDTITLELDETNDDVETNKKNQVENEITEEVIEKEDAKNNNTTIKDNTIVSASKLPKAGFNNLIFIMVVTFTICIGVLLIKYREYKDIK